MGWHCPLRCVGCLVSLTPTCAHVTHFFNGCNYSAFNKMSQACKNQNLTTTWEAGLDLGRQKYSWFEDSSNCIGRTYLKKKKTFLCNRIKSCMKRIKQRERGEGRIHGQSLYVCYLQQKVTTEPITLYSKYPLTTTSSTLFKKYKIFFKYSRNCLTTYLAFQSKFCDMKFKIWRIYPELNPFKTLADFTAPYRAPGNSHGLLISTGFQKPILDQIFGVTWVLSICHLLN